MCFIAASLTADSEKITATLNTFLTRCFSDDVECDVECDLEFDVEFDVELDVEFHLKKKILKTDLKTTQNCLDK